MMMLWCTGSWNFPLHVPDGETAAIVPLLDLSDRYHHIRGAEPVIRQVGESAMHQTGELAFPTLRQATWPATLTMISILTLL